MFISLGAPVTLVPFTGDVAVDTAALKAALITPGFVHLEQKPYQVNDTLTYTSLMCLYAHGAELLFPDGFVLPGLVNDSYTSYGERTHDVAFYDLTLTGKPPADLPENVQAHLLMMQGVQNLLGVNLVFNNAAEDAVYAADHRQGRAQFELNENVTLLNPTIDGCDRNGIFFSSGKNILIAGGNIKNANRKVNAGSICFETNQGQDSISIVTIQDMVIDAPNGAPAINFNMHQTVNKDYAAKYPDYQHAVGGSINIVDCDLTTWQDACINSHASLYGLHVSNSRLTAKTIDAVRLTVINPLHKIQDVEIDHCQIQSPQSAINLKTVSNATIHDDTTNPTAVLVNAFSDVTGSYWGNTGKIKTTSTKFISLPLAS